MSFLYLCKLNVTLCSVWHSFAFNDSLGLRWFSQDMNAAESGNHPPPEWNSKEE